MSKQRSLDDITEAFKRIAVSDDPKTEPIRDAMRRMVDGLSQFVTDFQKDMRRRRELRDHIMRVNAGNRRRQGRVSR